jgi:hypothetical protein
MRALKCFAVACLLLASAFAMGAPVEYRYYDWGKTPKRDDYQFAVLTLALDKTSAEFGPYRAVRVLGDFSTLRVRQEVSAGKVVNVMAGPWRVLDKNDPLDQRIPINIPILAGLLGQRVLLIRSEDLPKFRAIRDASQLKLLIAGQGRGWTEIDLYRRNGYRISDTANIHTLLPMLASKRFDYLPMSVVEARSALAQYPELAGQLTIAPDLMISYPLPTIFYVSARQPQLAQRLERGLALASKDGSLNELLHYYFDKEMAMLGDVKHHFTMDDPSVPKSLLSDLPTTRRQASTRPHNPH